MIRMAADLGTTPQQEFLAKDLEQQACQHAKDATRLRAQGMRLEADRAEAFAAELTRAARGIRSQGYLRGLLARIASCPECRSHALCLSHSHAAEREGEVG